MDVWSSLTTNIHLGHSNQWDQSALCFFAQATRDCHKGACSSVPRPSLSLKTVSGGLISPIPFLSAHMAACCCSVCAGKHGGKIKISPEADMQSLVLAHGKLVSGSDPSRSITGQSQCWRNYLSIYRAAAWVFCASGLSHLPSASPVTGNEHAEHCWQRKIDHTATEQAWYILLAILVSYSGTTTLCQTISVNLHDKYQWPTVSEI